MLSNKDKLAKYSNKISRYIISFLIICIIAKESAATEMLFYKSPSAENLASVINDFNNQARQRADLKSYRHQREVMQHYLTLVFKEHPDLVDAVTAKINDYAPQMQDRIAQSIVNNDLTNKLPSKYHALAKDVSNIEEEFLRSYDSQSDVIHDVGLTDIFWMTYYVTGNENYIKKILKFAASFSSEVRTVAYEILNKEQSKEPYNDIKAKFSNIQFNEIQACTATLKSIIYNRQQYKDINDRVKSIISNDPSLNYAKDLQL